MVKNPKDKRSPGKCFICGKEIAPRTARGHLESCLDKRKSEGFPTRLFMIKVEGHGLGDYHYWMYLLMPEEAKLSDLDKFLRKTWLECCGHLSQFYVGRNIRIPMGKEIGAVLMPSMEILYDYDFGSTTTLKVSVVGVGGGSIGKRKIELVARNNALTPTCELCGDAATFICPQCAYEESGWLCEKCVEKHDCGLGAFLPIVNSPRSGVCGYTG
jgi:hypothetical protein